MSCKYVYIYKSGKQRPCCRRQIDSNGYCGFHSVIKKICAYSYANNCKSCITPLLHGKMRVFCVGHAEEAGYHVPICFDVSYGKSCILPAYFNNLCIVHARQKHCIIPMCAHIMIRGRLKGQSCNKTAWHSGYCTGHAVQHGVKLPTLNDFKQGHDSS